MWGLLVPWLAAAAPTPQALHAAFVDRIGAKTAPCDGARVSGTVRRSGASYRIDGTFEWWGRGRRLALSESADGFVFQLGIEGDAAWLAVPGEPPRVGAGDAIAADQLPKIQCAVVPPPPDHARTIGHDDTPFGRAWRVESATAHGEWIRVWYLEDSGLVAGWAVGAPGLTLPTWWFGDWRRYHGRWYPSAWISVDDGGRAEYHVEKVDWTQEAPPPPPPSVQRQLDGPGGPVRVTPVAVASDVIVVPGTVAGAPVPLLVDTGAPSVVVPEAFLPPGHRTETIATAGVIDAAGQATTGWLTTLAVGVGDAAPIDAASMVVAGEGRFVLLGNAFLDDYIVELGPELMLHPASGPAPDTSGMAALPIRYERGHLYVEATVAGRPLTMLFDTGASLTQLPSALVAELGVAPSGERTLVSGLGRTTQLPVYAIDGLVVGDLTLNAVDVVPRDERIVLGMSAFRGRRLVLSYADKTLYVSR